MTVEGVSETEIDAVTVGWGEGKNEKTRIMRLGTKNPYIEIVSENSVWGVKIGESTGLEPK